MKGMLLIGLSFTLFLATGCGKTRVSLLSERTEALNQSLRWSSLQNATPFFAQEVRKTLLNRFSDELARHKIVDFAVLDVGLDQEKKKGSVIVEYSYYGVSDQTLHARQELQIWHYDSKKGNWFLVEARSVPQKPSMPQ